MLKLEQITEKEEVRWWISACGRAAVVEEESPLIQSQPPATWLHHDFPEQQEPLPLAYSCCACCPAQHTQLSNLRHSLPEWRCPPHKCNMRVWESACACSCFWWPSSSDTDVGSVVADIETGGLQLGLRVALVVREDIFGGTLKCLTVYVKIKKKTYFFLINTE
jgi:hypothetical protein